MRCLLYSWLYLTFFTRHTRLAGGAHNQLQSITDTTCGTNPPKTAARVQCEDLHKENTNIARCPYAFPIHINGRLQEVEVSDDMRKLNIHMVLDIRWPVTRKNESLSAMNDTDFQGNASAKTSVNASRSAMNDTDFQGNASANTSVNASRSSHCGISNELWTPQMYVPMSYPIKKEGDGLIKHINIDASDTNGEYNMQLQLFSTVLCNSSLQHYPLDTHVCIFYVAVFQTQNYSLQLFWDKSTPSTPELLLQGLAVSVSFHNESIIHYASLDSRQASQLPIVLKVRRHRWHAVFYVYLPSCFMVLIGWLAFYIPDELAEGRVLVTFLNLVGTAHLFRILQRLPQTGATTAIDVWILSVVVFVWVSVVACFLDLDYAFRSIEREQQESVDDVLFFYQQPGLARKMADTGHREALQRRRLAVGSEATLFGRFRRQREQWTLRGRGRRQESMIDGPSPSVAGVRQSSAGHDDRKSYFDRRRVSTKVGEDLFFDAEMGVEEEDMGIEWVDFHQWVHQRHLSRHPNEETDDDEEGDDGSQWSVQSLLQTMWSIRKEYRWLNWSDYVSKCVEIMYPVFFCTFLVIYCLVYVPESYTNVPTT